MSKPNNPIILKVFFIASNQTNLDDKLQYSIEKRKGIFDLVKEKSITYRYNNRENFTIKIFSFNYNPSELAFDSKDQATQKYKAKINLCKKNVLKSDNFIGKILFKNNKNNFIYDLKFESNNWFNSAAPVALYLKHSEQFNYYHLLLKELKIKIDDKLSEALILDTQNFFVGQDKKFYFDFFLDVFKFCFKLKIVRPLLMAFKQEKVMIPDKINVKFYSSLLNLISQKLEIINKNAPKIEKHFFFLLLFFKMHYEKETIKDLLKRKEIWKYILEILIVNSNIFKEIEIPDELLNELLKSNNLTPDKLKNILSYINSLEKMLIFLNNNYDFIFNICKNNKVTINLSNYISLKQKDNFNNIAIELEKLINNQKNRELFILINKELWDSFINNYNKKDYKKLILIKKTLESYKKIDKNLARNYTNNIDYKIHDTGVELINQGKIKNNDLLEFIENDIYIKDLKTHPNIIYRPISILEKGLDIENLNKEFYEKWKNLHIFELFKNHKLNFHKVIINKINSMKNFKILYYIFDLYNKNNEFDRQATQILSQKFQSLLITYKKEDCPDFVPVSALLINLIDTKTNIKKKFLKDVIEKSSLPMEIIFQIYIYLLNNYTTSNEIIDCIIEYFTKNKGVLKVENILFLLNRLESEKIIKEILNQINTFVLKEKDIFNIEEETDSFKLFKGIQEENLKNKLKRYPKIENTNYFSNISKVKQDVSYNLLNGIIKYNIIYPWWSNQEKREILKERIKVLFFNEEILEKWENSIKSFYFSNREILSSIKNILLVLNDFYPISQKDNIKQFDDLENQIKNGLLKDIQKINKNHLEGFINNIVPDYEKKKKLRDSLFFLKIFHSKKEEEKNSRKSEEKIFTETEKDFEKLILLFKENWVTQIDEYIINDCYKVIKESTDNQIKSELNKIKKYFNLKNIEDNKIVTIVNELIIFSKKEEIFSIVNSCLSFIKDLDSEETNFSAKLKEIGNEITQSLSIEKINEYCEFLEKNEIKILAPKPEDKDLMNFLNMLYITKGSLKLIISLKEEDCRYLQEVAFDLDNCFITSVEIQEMSKCSNFIRNLNIANNNTPDIEIISKLKKALIEYNNILPYFQSYTTHYSQIKDLFMQKLDKTQATRQKIKNISKKSHFSLSIHNDKEDYYSFFGNYLNEEENQDINKIEVEKNISFEDLIELRGRAMLAKRLGEEKLKEEKEIFELNQLFSERVNEISKINLILKKIAMKGYSEDITISIDIIDSKPFYGCDSKDFKDYQDCIQYLNDILSKTIEIQIYYYKNYQFIRYIYGRQFNLFNCFLKRKGKKSLESFLKFISNDMLFSSIKFDQIQYMYINDLDDDKYKCLLENCNKFLTSFFNDNGLSLEMFLEQNKILPKFKEFTGLYTYLLEDDKIEGIQKGIEEQIISWYHFLTGHLPMAQTLLLCNEETTVEEITAFLYRAFLCEYHILFMVGKIELLTPEKRQTLTNLINTLYMGHDKEMKSCLAFAYSEKNSTIVQYLETIKGKKILFHKDKRINQEILYDENVEIMSSDKCGVGKSTQIKMEIEKNQKKYIHFPFGGVFNRKEVINRLKKIIIQNEDINQTVIHLDLYDTNQIELMKDFLFFILFTKLYGQNESLFYLSKQVEIKIEIPCGFINFFSKFPILKMFKNSKKISFKDLPPLIVPQNIDSNMQIVCNYLKLLKEQKLSKKDLYIENISGDVLETKETKIDAQLLSQEECSKLIKEYLKIENPNYYQINSFINILSGQLKKFSYNAFLTAENLITNGTNLRIKNFENLRIAMVEGFIKNTEHFTKGAFDELLNSQIQTFDTFKINIKNGKYDEEKDNLIAIEALSKQKDTIAFNKIKPSLIFFHEGEGQGFSIISTCQKDEKEYLDLLNLRNSQIRIDNYMKEVYNKDNKNYEKQELYKDLNDYYNNFSQKDFMKELKEILNIKNPLDKNEIEKIRIEKLKKDELKKKEKEKKEEILKNEKEELNKINDIDDFILFQEKEEENEKKEMKSIEEIVGEYVFTADNFIKMVLILLRIRENIPVIMMGETGCGKTSLIRKLSELMNNGEDKMKILNIHAGVTDQEIVNFLYSKKDENSLSIIEEAKLIQEREEIEKQLMKEKNLIYNEKKLWIFLDEINTCDCMGLIYELMTKNSCQGVPLPKSLVFIGACNPYRMAVKTKEQNGLKIKDAKERKLVYTVNPLPHSLLNFVFNFGSLNKIDERKYINNMVIKPITNLFFNEIKKNLEENEINKIKEQRDQLIILSIKAIADSQDFIRDSNDVSSVSLREIRRFSIFYSFFIDYLKKKKEILNSNKIFRKDAFYNNINFFEINKYAINLSIYICYYLRLTTKEDREKLSEKLSKHFNYKLHNFEQIPQKEQEYIADNIKMKEGIAKNKALLENIFTLFSCVNAKVPLFIVGKPGCSKSLSVNLIFKSMNGENSTNHLFKTLPKLISYSYQGSKASTSEGILKIFQKARQILEKQDKNSSKIISMVYFDEMGLAEHSENNPLKVIHSELEYDLNEGRKKVAFVGISNWILDASKMNRGIFLSIPKPDCDDLQKTAQIIAESYNENLAKQHREFFETLAITYYKYKEKLIKEYTIKEEFHGSRDFYHLIKNAAREIIKKSNEQKNEIDEQSKKMIGINCLERNFGGLEFDKGKKTSLEIIKEIYKDKYEDIPITKKYDILQKIKENINDPESRYLLLISKSSVSYYLLMSILNNESANKSCFYIGSRFKQDQLSEEYTLKILNKVQLQMEQNKVLLLSDLEPVYPSLYDLFNQNFYVVSDKNYARIALGSSNNTFSLVNDNFKCIVLVDQNVIDDEEPPFLNRFEKHIISFEYLLKDKMLEPAEEIYQTILNITKMFLPKEEIFELHYNINDLLLNCDKEEIYGIIYSRYCELRNKENRNASADELQEYVFEKIALGLPQDIILFLKYSGFKTKFPNIYEQILHFYNKGDHRNLYNFLGTMKNIKNIIYTFSSIEEPILSKKNQIINTEMFGKINKDNISEIMISSLTSENQLEEELENFYFNPAKKIFVFKFNPYETDIMNYLKFFIENQISEKFSTHIDEDNNYNNKYKKAFIFIIHLNRIFNKDLNDPKKEKYIKRNQLGELISYLSDFYQIFIDNLNGQNDSLLALMECNNEMLFSQCLKLNKEFMTNIYNAFSYFNYKFKINLPYLNESNYSKFLIKYLQEEQELSQKIIKCILKQPIKVKDIFIEILKKKYINQNDIDIIHAVKRYLSELFTNILTQFVFKSEQEYFLSTFLYNKIVIFKEIDFEIISEDKNNYNKNKSIFDEFYDDEIEEELNLYPEDDEIIISQVKSNLQKNNNNTNLITKDNKIEIYNSIDKKERYFLGNKIIEKIIDFYLEKFDLSSTKKFDKNIKKNNIKLLLGLKIPGIKNILESIRTFIKTELKNKYSQKENNIRNLCEEEKDKELQKNKNMLSIYEEELVSEINKKDIFNYLNNLDKEYSNDLNQFYEWLLDDYFLLYLSDCLQDIKNEFSQMENYKQFLKKCISLRFNNQFDDDPLLSFAKKILWLESNIVYISALLDIYKRLSINEENLLLKIDEIIDSQAIQYERSDRCPQFTEEFNSAFFFLTESLLKISITNNEMYIKIKPKDFQKFMASLKIILQNAFKIDNNLNSFYSKEIFSLQQFLIIYEKLNNVNQITKENIINVLKILSNQSKYINNFIKEEKDCEDLCDNIEILFNFLNEKLGNTNNFAELILNIFVDEAKKIKSQEYRKKLTEIILKNPMLIKKSYPFFSIILNFLSSDVSDDNPIKDNLNKLENSMNSCIQLINKADNEILNQIILSIFENIFNIYFNSIPEINENLLKRHFNKYYQSNKNLSALLLDYSLDLFNDCLNHLEDIFNNRNKEEKAKNNQLICSLYCIAFIKMYLYKSIYYLHKYNQQFLFSNDIMTAIIGNAKNRFRNIIKIYVFKIFFYLYDNFYYNIDNINYSNKGITFYEDVRELFNENKESMLNYYFIPIEDEEYQNYCSLSNIFENDKLNKFSNPIEDFKQHIEKNGIDHYFSVSSNIIISSLCLNNYINSEEYKNYSSFAKNLFEKNLKIPNEAKKLIFLFSIEEEFNKIIKPKILEKEEKEKEEEKEGKEGENEEEGKEEKGEEIINNRKISPKILEILLHSLRICIQTTYIENKDKNLYSEIISPSILEIIDNNCIPGNNLINNIYVNNYQKIENHLMTQPSDRGIYVCSCGLSYIIEANGFPSPPENEEEKDEFLCKNCKKKIGYDKPPKDVKRAIHGMVIREGHYRIFKDEKQKAYEMNLYGDTDKNIPNILLYNYKNEIIQPILEKYNLGINIIPKTEYSQPNLRVRNLSQIGFRLLNFIIYSHLFFSNCLGFISEEELKRKYLCNGMTCIDMIVKNWDLLKENLQSKYGIVIQIFMNIIFRPLSKILKNCKLMKTNKESEKFENEIEDLIKISIEKYEDNSKKYIEKNIEQLQLNKELMKSLVLENFDINLYSEDLYPFYKYFLMTTYPSVKILAQELKNIPEYENKYPLLASYLKIIKRKIDNEDNIIPNEDYYKPEKEELIKYLPEFNEFSNLMIDIYSYRISRKEASNLTLDSEDTYKYNKEGFKDLCDNFIKIWDKIGPYAKKYDNQEMDPISLKTNMKLVNFLNDKEEKGKGMYIAAAYQNFIEWQNNYLDKLIDPLRHNPFLNHFIKNIQKKIDIQNAKNIETLNFDEVNDEFHEQVFINCKRDIFTDSNKINYINYKKLVFDFDLIEKYLGERLLVNKTRFNDYKKLKFVTYCFEAFKENKNSIYIEFEKFYEQKVLDIDSRQKIYDYIMDIIFADEDFYKILFSLQLLFYYLIQEAKGPKEEIKLIIQELPYYVNISNEARVFFEKNEIKVEELLDTYLFIELITFNFLVKDLNEKYKKIIDNKTIDEIKMLFSQSKFSVINKNDLSSACRKIISRYLINTNEEDIEGNENNLLELYLDREELWKKEIWNKNELLKNDIKLLKGFNITIGHCFNLYNLLKEKEDIELKGIILKKEQEDDDNKLGQSVRIIPKRKKKY